jgi:hypothetical protein
MMQGIDLLGAQGSDHPDQAAGCWDEPGLTARDSNRKPHADVQLFAGFAASKL